MTVFSIIDLSFVDIKSSKSMTENIDTSIEFIYPNKNYDTVVPII